MAEAGFRQARRSVTSFGALFCKTAGPIFTVGTHRYASGASRIPFLQGWYLSSRITDPVI